jgi:peptidoglycan hydrolase-like protein with peptidoglycan-binding domain
MRASAPRFLAGLLFGFILAIGAGSNGAGQTPPPATARVVAPDPAVETARAAFEALPLSERKAVQEALVWLGDYSGMADGTFGRQTYEAVLAYQRRGKGNPDGVLDEGARAGLRASAQQARERAGFEVVDDQRSGVRIGVPGRLLTKRDVNQSGGTRWQSADDKVTLDTRSVPVPNEGLQALYDRNLAIRTPGRTVTYKAIRPDFFVIAGETPAGKFYTRYAAREGGLRGFSIGYDKTLAKDIDHLVVAIANSFTAFPPPPPAPVAQPTPPAATRRENSGGLAGTGLVIGPHLVATTIAPEGCPNLRAGGLKPRQVRKVQELTLLEFAEALRSAPLSLADRPLDPNSSLLVLAYARQGSGRELVVVPASGSSDETISAPLQPGAKGAPVVDRSGVLHGLVRNDPDERRAVAGIVPPAHHKLQSAGLAETIEAGPARADKPSQASAAEMVTALRASIVPVTCGP